MNKWTLIFFVLLPLSLFANERHKLKKYRSKAGDQYKSKKSNTGKLTIRVNGKVVKKEETLEEFDFIDTILAMEKGKISKRKRVYSKCISNKKVMVNGRIVQNTQSNFSFIGKTITIVSRIGKEPIFTYKNGQPVLGAEARFLKKKFFKRRKGKTLDDQSMLPKSSIEEGENWNLPKKLVQKAFGIQEGSTNLSRSSAKGYLNRIFFYEGSKMGEVRYSINLKIVKMPKWTSANGSFRSNIKSTICVDGSINKEDTTGTVRTSINGRLRSPQGMVDLSISGIVTVKTKKEQIR